MTAVSKTQSTPEIGRNAGELAWSGNNGRALAFATEQWFAATAECQREMMQFVSMRLQKDRSAAGRILDCKNMGDVTAVQSRWIEETVQDYNSEMLKMMEICSTSMKSGTRVG
jgi:hypothetical protein